MNTDEIIVRCVKCGCLGSNTCGHECRDKEKFCALDSRYVCPCCNQPAELFELPECKSPRLLWMEKHGIEIEHRPEFDGTDEDENGDTLLPYMAWSILAGLNPPGHGMTADGALTDWAMKHGVHLWNEEAL